MDVITVFTVINCSIVSLIALVSGQKGSGTLLCSDWCGGGSETERIGFHLYSHASVCTRYDLVYHKTVPQVRFGNVF